MAEPCKDWSLSLNLRSLVVDSRTRKFKRRSFSFNGLEDDHTENSNLVIFTLTECRRKEVEDSPTTVLVTRYPDDRQN